jgi:methionyl-tRNA synthetase
MNTFYVTTPIYYANSLPHLGHLYTMIVADTIARSKRQRGVETYFLTGTDEHGINIERAAQKAGRTPQEQADYVVSYFKRMTSVFGLDTEHGGYDIFMRTTAPFHYAGVQELWRRCARAKTPKGNDAIYKGHYEGWFCAACAEYKTEDEYQKGDPPTCLIHDTQLDRVSEESYFFRLSDFDQALLAVYASRPDFIRPEARANEVISFVRGGLQDLSISRLRTSVSWGVPVPDDPAHTMYVWFDALINYITAIGFGNEERERAVGFKKFWPALHLVGKDILRFSCCLLARVFARRGCGTAARDRCARNVGGSERSQDVENAWEHDRIGRVEPPLLNRRGSLLLFARDGVWPGRAFWL